MIGVFVPPAPEEHINALRAFAAGLANLNVEHFVTNLNYRDCDVAVVFGVRKEQVPVSWARGEIIRRQREAGRLVLVIEKGFVKRDEYYHVGFNGLNGRASFRNADMPPDRWDKLGVELKDWKRGEHVLLCGQVPWDASVQYTKHIQWCQQTMAKLRKLTNRPIRFRPHPKANVNYGIYGEISTASLEEDLKDAHAVVTFNSNSAVEAVIEGIPIFAEDMGSMAYEVATNQLALIATPKMPKRINWACDLAYAQWNLEEMERGEPWQHLMR